jgi:hypothetical protein
MDKIKQTLLDILGWIGSSPFRLFTVILLSVFGFVGWVAYTEKDAFMASYRAQQALPKMNGNYQAASNFIFKNSKAELVAIFEVNTLLNTRKLVFLSTRSKGKISDHDGADVGLLTNNYDNNNDVIGLMSGKIPCSPYLKPQSYIGFTYKEQGTQFMCRISVPVEPGMFIGQISVGWKEEPEDLENAQTVMVVASNLLYNKKP